MYYRVIDENPKFPYKVGDTGQFSIFGVLWMCQIISIDERYHSFDVLPLSKIEEPLYKLSEVKKAFWDTFHKSGEIFFNYFENDEFRKPEDSTNSYWQEFLDNLNKE